jgi:hypothetical protein
MGADCPAQFNRPLRYRPLVCHSFTLAIRLNQQSSTAMTFPETITQIQLHAECTDDYDQYSLTMTKLYVEIMSAFTESLAVVNKRYKLPCPYGTYLEGSIDSFLFDVERSGQDDSPTVCMQATIKLLRPLIAPPKGSSYTCQGTAMPIPGVSDLIMAKLEEIYESVCGGVIPNQTPAEGA